MLLFRSEENVGAWCRVQQMPQGQLLTLDQVWGLSQRWYSDRLSPVYAGRALDQVEEIFRSVGLTDPFWHMPDA